MTKVREGNQGISEQNMVLLPGAGIYAPKDLKEARHHSCLRQEWCLRQPLKHACKFSLSIFMGSFYSPVQTLGSVQIHVSLTRGIVQWPRRPSPVVPRKAIYTLIWTLLLKFR